VWSRQPFVSIHLLGNGVGCLDRHVYESERGDVKPFRSAYLKVRST